MGKVNASLEDVQTEFVAPKAGDYEMKVTEIDESQKTGENPFIVIKSAIDEPGNEEHGKPIYDRLYMKTKEGADNRYSLAQIKRYFIAITGAERANARDLDYDELKNGRFRGVIVNNNYTDKKTQKEKVGAEFADILPL